jgi:hypothetical protein
MTILQGDLGKQPPLFNLDLQDVSSSLEAYFLPQYQFSHLTMYF